MKRVAWLPVAACLAANTQAHAQVSPPDVQKQRELIQFVTAYVIQKIGWPEHSFTVEVDLPFDGNLVFMIAKKGRPLGIGGDEYLFGVIVHPSTHEIIGLLNYQ